MEPTAAQPLREGDFEGLPWAEARRVLEGEASKVRDHETLLRVADAYAAKYGWEVTVRDGALHGEGAPTAGPPRTRSTG